GSLVSMDGEVGAVHPAQIAAAALFRMHDVRRMVALGIKSRGKRQHLGGAELHAEATSLAALDNDRNTSLSHETPTPRRLRPGFRVDYDGRKSHPGVMGITGLREARHAVEDLAVAELLDHVMQRSVREGSRCKREDQHHQCE